MLCIKALQFCFCFLCVGLATRYKELKVCYTAHYLYMECQKCPETADANAVDVPIPNKTRTICNVFEATLGFNFFDYIEDTFQLFAR